MILENKDIKEDDSCDLKSDSKKLIRQSIISIYYKKNTVN